MTETTTTKEPEPAEESESIRAILSKIVGSVRQTREVPSRCAELRIEEEACDGLFHSRLHDREHGVPVRTVRRCPESIRADNRRRVAAEAHRLRHLLRKAGVDPTCKDVGAALARVIAETWQPTPGVDKVRQMVSRVQRHPVERNVLLLGEPGLGKTTAQLAVYFAQLQLGINARFVDNAQMRVLAKSLTSGLPDVLAEAEREREMLRNCAVLLWSDLADTDAPNTTYPDQGMPALLQALFEGGGFCLVASSNLALEDLQRSPNVGKRALDRMLSDVTRAERKAAVVITLSGKSHRRTQ